MECIITLIAEETRQDEDGYRYTSETLSKVYAKKKSVRRSEFYKALNSGVICTAEFEVFLHDYNNERLVEYNGRRYKIERTYSTSPDRINLTCSEVKRQ